MQNQPKNNSGGTPLLIIGAVFLIAIIGGWWLYSSSKTPPKPATNTGNSNNGTNAPTQKDIWERASLGAQPPHVLGSPNSAVTVEEFADFQCPTCASVQPLMKQITSAYGGRIKFIFRNYPLIQVHDKAYDAAVAAEAAGMQGKFWDMQNLLFTNQRTWVASANHRQQFADYAEQLGLNVEKFQTDMLGIPAKSRVDADLQRARSLQVRSTPTVYINGVEIPFSQVTVEGLSQYIDSELQKANAGKPAQGGATEPKAGESK
ncbi:MAG: thioredoxin domain-containing protein [Pyrinomonadaceae bacterium]